MFENEWSPRQRKTRLAASNSLATDTALVGIIKVCYFVFVSPYLFDHTLKRWSLAGSAQLLMGGHARNGYKFIIAITHILAVFLQVSNIFLCWISGTQCNSD